MTGNESHTSSGNRIARPRTVGLGLAGAVAAAIALVVILGRPAAGPGVTPPASGGPVSASCVDPYSLATLAKRSWAFDGIVSAISGDQATFTVNTWFRGGSSNSVTLTATGMTGTSITSAGGPTLVVGQRFLVAGEETFAWPCGFTQPYDAAVAAQWADASKSQ